jgi:hypothetical protein
VLTGALQSGSVAGLGADDSNYYVLSTLNSSAQWWASFKNVPPGFSSLKVTYNGHAGTSCTQNVSLWNWYYNAWVNVSHTTAPTADSTITVAAPGLPSDYVFMGEVRASVQCFSTGAPPFTLSSDLLKISYS